MNFIGLDTQYPTADGQQKRRIHLDGAASPLAASAGLEAIQRLLPHYSNSHSYVHGSAKISTQALDWANSKVLEFLGADENEYAAIFTGAGATAAINRIARGLANSRADRPIVLVSAMEHHANDLPHRQFENQIEYIPLTGEGASQGCVDLNALETILKKHKHRVNYIALSSVSNVTGISNPVTEVCDLAHQYGVLVLVDAAQAVAHRPTQLSRKDGSAQVDFLVFSGHKVYAPSAPGVLVAKKALLQELPGQDLGGGSVADVSYFDFQLLDNYPDREQSGTPNIIGAYCLASVLEQLQIQGMDVIEKHALTLMNQLQLALSNNPNITVYGDPNLQRIGAISFNHRMMDHGLLAAILNDYFSIAVRNECFCAHPYVSSMLKQSLWDIDLSEVDPEQHQALINRKRGMVRVSLSLYNTSEDVQQLVEAINEIEQNLEHFAAHYSASFDGSYTHNEYELDWTSFVSKPLED